MRPRLALRESHCLNSKLQDTTELVKEPVNRIGRKDPGSLLIDKADRYTESKLRSRIRLKPSSVDSKGLMVVIIID